MVVKMSEINQSKKKHRKGSREENLDIQRVEEEWESLKNTLKETKNAPSQRAKKQAPTRKAAGNTAEDKITIGRKENYKKEEYKKESYEKGSERKGSERKGSERKDSERKGSDKNKSEKREAYNKVIDKNAAERPSKFSARENGLHNNPQRTGSKIRKSEGCPHLRDCGGCQVKQQEYQEHLKQKQSQVEALLGKYCRVENIIGMKEPYHYRNKVHAVFDHDRKGNPISGVYEEGTHKVIPVDSCMIHNKKADEIIVSIRNMLKSFKIKTYDEDTGYGLLRHVLVRTGFSSGEIMVVLVLSSPIFPSKNNFIKALRQLHPEITTVILNVNDKATSMILGEREIIIYGKGYIEDILCGKVFRISPKSFYQVNPVQTEVIYQKAIEFAGLAGKETVIDAYCGIGTISLIAADHAKKVIGVELNKDAVKDAIINGKRNQSTNVEFYTQDAGEFMSQLAASGESAGVVFLDPPRAGCDEIFLNSLCKLKPDRVVYVSCNPVTLERDLQYLTNKGYKALRVVPVDMFPWTSHVETVVLMCASS